MTDYLTVANLRDTADKVRYSDLQPGDRIARPRTGTTDTQVTFQTFTQAAIALAKGHVATVTLVSPEANGGLYVHVAERNGVPYFVPSIVVGTRTLKAPPE